jgi:radical SAM superfamily enzyme YgiQ (UPF0313 family)
LPKEAQVSFERPRIIRPPHEADNYFLPLTAGCSSSQCGFCNYYYGRRLQVRDLEEILAEIDALALFLDQGTVTPGMPETVYAIASQWNRKRLFLQDGDALVYPYSKLVRVLERINEKLPGLERISSFSTTQDLLKRSVDELKALRDLKLELIYLGVESGDDEILEYVSKGVTGRQTVEAGRKVKEAGIELATTVILGLGGQDKSEQHVLGTAKVLSDMDPDSCEALTLTIMPNVPLFEDQQAGRFRDITPMQSLAELRLMIEASNFSNCLFRSEHESNYLTVHGYLPREKERLLGELDYVLSRQDPALLRPEHLRGL